MKLTPMDIKNKEFKRGLRGYNPDEVDEFLEEVVENYEDLYKESSRMRDQIAKLNEKIEHYNQIESTIQNTLVLAQNAADQAKASSQKEADMIVKNANETAQRIVDKAHTDVIQISDEYDRLKQEFIKFRSKFRNFMNTQLETFDELEKELTKHYNITNTVEDEVEAKDISLTFEEDEDMEQERTSMFNDDIDEIKSFFVEDEEEEEYSR